MKTFQVKIRGGSTVKIQAEDFKFVVKTIVDNWPEEIALNVVKIEELKDGN